MGPALKYAPENNKQLLMLNNLKFKFKYTVDAA